MSISNVKISRQSWEQAKLPIRLGGLGIRSVQDLALPCYIASLNAALPLLRSISSELFPVGGVPPTLENAIHKFSVVTGIEDRPPTSLAGSQRAWDTLSAAAARDRMVDAANQLHRARLVAASQPHTAAWLQAVPVPSLSLHLDEETVRVAVALRLGATVCEQHRCRLCGRQVDTLGLHGLSCLKSAGRLPRHAQLNEVIRRGLTSAGFPSILEPVGLDRGDGRRPDGLTLFPYREGMCLTWDATCTDTYADSVLTKSALEPGTAARAAEERKRRHYSEISSRYKFAPIAVETSGVLGPATSKFVRELGQLISARTGERRETAWLHQRLSIAVVRGNAAAVLATAATDRAKADRWPHPPQVKDRQARITPSPSSTDGQDSIMTASQVSAESKSQDGTELPESPPEEVPPSPITSSLDHSLPIAAPHPIECSSEDSDTLRGEGRKPASLHKMAVLPVSSVRSEPSSQPESCDGKPPVTLSSASEVTSTPEMETRRAQNEALRLCLAAYEPTPGAGAAPADPADTLASERRLQELQEEQERVQEQLESARLAIEQEQERETQRRRAEEARKEQELRAEEEARRRKLEEEARRKKLEEEARRKKLEDEARKKKAEEEEKRRRLEEEESRRRRAAEEQRRLEEQERLLEEQERRQERREWEAYRAPLRPDGSSGGGGLKRSHSSPFIAGPGQEQAAAVERAPPAFSRETKPLVRARRGDVQAARTRRFAPSFGSVAPALTGLKNLGNTCYMNAVVQCINNTPSLSDFFVSESYQDFINYESELSRGEAVQELAAAVKVLWSGHYRSVALYDLKDVMGRQHGRFRGSAQQDAHEFLMYLLNFLHEDLNEERRKQPLKEQENDGVPDARAAKLAWDDFKGSNRSFILNLFWGQHKSTLRCSRCGNQSVKFETFSHLSVPMPARSSRCSLHECIQLYVAGDTISGWTCPKCKSSIEATKRLDLWRLPPVLIIHIQRFYNDGLWRKKQSNVQFPLDNLDMSPFVINKEARYRHHQYHLYGVVNHFGSMESGHYTAFCRGATSGRWHRFDDHEVYQLNSGGVQSFAGYILFYSAIDGRS